VSVALVAAGASCWTQWPAPEAVERAGHAGALERRGDPIELVVGEEAERPVGRVEEQR
jgi:hypothetical protein